MQPVLLVLGALSAFGPLSMDLYLPALPGLAADLGVSSSTAQLTMTSCMVGLAVGQFITGPLSDRFGRRRPLLIGVLVYAIASLLCAISPGAGVLIGLRLVQGLAGGAGIVIARAVVRDLYDTDAAARVFSMLMIVTGAAPVLAPVIGGQLLHVTSWRGLFVVLSLIGCVLLVASAITIHETRRARPVIAAHSAIGDLRAVMQDPRFVGFMLVQAFASGMLFAYITMSAFVLQDQFGFSSQSFSFVFAINSVGLVAAGRFSAGLVGRVGPVRTLVIGATVGLAGAVMLLVGAALAVPVPVPVLLVVLFVTISSVSLTMPTATALGMHHHGDRAGTASGVLGLAQFGFGSVVGPLASVMATSMLSMSLAMVVTTAATCVALGMTIRITSRAGTSPKLGTTEEFSDSPLP